VYPFERFTEQGKHVLALAQQEAERGHSSYIGAEHLLLALVGKDGGVACEVLRNLGVDARQVRSTIESVLAGTSSIRLHQIIPTSRVKQVIQAAFTEAARMGATLVGTEHLLVGLLVEGENIGAHVLEDLGVTLDEVRVEIARVASEDGPERPAEGS
jgi:ATP-dependent Clp protease ATP-binding subunit ClpC